MNWKEAILYLAFVVMGAGIGSYFFGGSSAQTNRERQLEKEKDSLETHYIRLLAEASSELAEANLHAKRDTVLQIKYRYIKQQINEKELDILHVGDTITFLLYAAELDSFRIDP